VSWDEFTVLASMCNITTEMSVRDAALHLHDAGIIFYVNSNERLARHVVLEPRYIAHFISVFLQNAREQTPRGIIQPHALRQYVKGPMFPTALHGYLITLLEHFGLAYRYTGLPDTPLSPHSPHQRLDNSLVESSDTISPLPTWDFWVPLLLPAQPAGLEKRWPAQAPKGTLQFGRRYTVPLDSDKFLWSAMTRLLRFCPCTLIWRYGMLIEPTDSPESGEQILLVSHNPEPRYVEVWVRATNRLTSLYQHVFETLETIKRTDPLGLSKRPDLSKRTGSLGKRPTPQIATMVPCIHCINNNDSSPHYFNMADCERAAIQGTSISTEYS